MKNKIYLIILVLFSVSINQYFANRGVFPIDNFLIFDAAYNITLGSHPFKDYWLITGPFLDYVQSIFFIIFGINWFSYVLHASIINMVFTLFSFYFFLNLGLRNIYSFIYSLGIAILAYPSIGTPFIDHHSVIFALMSLYSLSLGILLKKNLFWFLSPLFLVFSFFSKQIPSSYLIILFTLIIFIYFISKDSNRKNLISLFFGSIFSLLLIISVFYINAIPFNNFITQYILYPSSLGDERINKLNIDFKNLISQFKFVYLALLPLIVSAFLIIRSEGKNLINKKEFIVLMLFLFSVLIIIYCQLLTRNQILIFFLIPISAAISHIYSIKYFNKKYLIYFILGIFIFSTGKYHIRFNLEKKFIELSNVNFNLSESSTQIDDRLKGLKWITPDFSKNPSHEINLLIKTKNILLEKKERKIIVTDYQFFSSLLNNKFASPNKWYDDLSIPRKKSNYYKIHRDFFLEKIKINKIKYMYFIGNEKHTMNFFDEFIFRNKCIVSKKINELLIEFSLNKCDKIL